MRKQLMFCFAVLFLALFGGIAAQAQSGSYFTAITNLNPLGYWPLNETNPIPYGVVATNYGTLGSAGNALYSPGGITAGLTGPVATGDSAIETDGASGIVGVPLSLAGPFSAEVWLNCANPATELSPLACVDASSPRSGWLIYMAGQAAGSYNFRMYNKNGATVSLNISSAAGGITAGTWHHVVVVYDGTEGYIYVDGQLANSGTPTSFNGLPFVPNDAGSLTIGGRSDAGFLFNGEEAEVAIYTNALTAGTILAHYQAGTNPTPPTNYAALVLASNPLIYYPLNEPTYTAPLESSDPVANNYGSSGTADNGFYLPGCFPGGVPGPKVAGFQTTNPVACHFDHVYNYGGLGGYVDVIDGSSTFDLSGPVTLTAWIQGNGENNGNFQSFAGRGDASYRGDVDASGDAHFADGPNPDDTGAFVNDGNWHFIAGTWDGTNEYVYIDGALSQVQSAAAAIAGDTLHFVIGGDGQYSTTGSRVFNGNVSQVAVFGATLSAAQVQSLFYSAEVLPYITQQPASSLTIVEFTSGSLSVTANGSPALGYQWYDGPTKLSNGGDYAGVSTPTLTISPTALGDAGAYTVVITNAYGSITSSVASVAITQAPAILSNLTTNPATVYVGDEIVYDVVVVGLQPLTYRWYKGGTLIPGVTSSNYVFAATSGTNTYKVTISNSFGIITSAVATAIGEAFVSPPGGFAVNFSVGPGSVTPYEGLGAYEDLAANTNWNLIPAASGTPTGFAVSSGGAPTLVTMTLNWGFNNSGLPNLTLDPNGTVGYLVGSEDAVNTGSPGIGTSANPEGSFTVNGLPPGHYSLYLYAANYNGDRGSVFTLAPVNGGYPDGGTNFTLNGAVLGIDNDFAPGTGAALNGGASQNTSGQPELADTDNYIVFHNVAPDPTGTVSGTYIPLNPNPISGNTQEAPFNGLQLALQQISIVYSAGSVTVTWSGGALYSAPTVLGPWTLVAPVGTAGYPINTGYNGSTGSITTPATGAEQYFLVY
jgi:Concanavalin A-like lectin/glucanases superfamily/Immunoglobulin I-set domain